MLPLGLCTYGQLSVAAEEYIWPADIDPVEGPIGGRGVWATLRARSAFENIARRKGDEYGWYGRNMGRD